MRSTEELALAEALRLSRGEALLPAELLPLLLPAAERVRGAEPVGARALLLTEAVGAEEGDLRGDREPRGALRVAGAPEGDTVLLELPCPPAPPAAEEEAAGLPVEDWEEEELADALPEALGELLVLRLSEADADSEA